MRKYLILLLFTIGAFTSCWKDDCRQVNKESDVLIYNFLLKNYVNYFQNGKYVKSESNPDTLKGKDARLLLELELQDSILATRIVNNQFSLIPSAYACTASWHDYIPIHKVVGFSIRTLHALDSAHEIGSDASDVFSIGKFSIADFNSNIFDLMEYERSYYIHRIDFELDSGNYYNGIMQFEFTSHMDDGSKIINNSAEVYYQP